MKSAGLMLVVLAVVLAGCGRNGQDARCPSASGAVNGQDARCPSAGAPEMRPLVKTVHAERRAFSDDLRVQGTVRVKNSAVVSARVPGTIDEIFVEEGAHVTNGAALFRVDRVNLENAVAQTTAARASAAAMVGEMEAAIEKAKWDDARMARLYEGKAVTKDAFEKARLQLKTVTAKLDAVRAQLAQAEAAVKSAKKNLADSVVRAPFAGIITKKHKDAGDYVAPGAPVFAMDDPSICELCVSLAAVHYPKVEVGKTSLVLLENGSTNRLAVTYKAPRVDPLTRTFEIRCVLTQRTGAFVQHSTLNTQHFHFPPGLLLDAKVVFSTAEAQAVPEAAVGIRGGRSVVFAVKNGKVVSTPVETGARTEGWIEVRSPSLAGADIVAEGMLLLNEGEEVRHVSQ